MITIDEVYNEILKFSPTVLDIGDPVDEYKIVEFEKQHDLVLPNDYKTLLRKTNGLSLMGTSVYGMTNGVLPLSLAALYKFEHYEVDNEMPRHLIPFSPDGAGNHYCFDTKKCDDRSCEIVFWQHDCDYREGDSPVLVNSSFTEWAKEVFIDWKQ